MAAYASHQRDSRARSHSKRAARLELVPSAGRAGPGEHSVSAPSVQFADLAPSMFDRLIDQLADRLAAAVAERLGCQDTTGDEWLDSRHAAEYLGVHRDTLRKLAAERAIPSEQDGPGCKLYFRRSALEAWRRCGGQPRHLATVVANAA